MQGCHLTTRLSRLRQKKYDKEINCDVIAVIAKKIPPGYLFLRIIITYKSSYYIKCLTNY